MPPKIGGRNRSENVGRSRETKMLGVETYDIMAFFTCVCKTRQDKTRQCFIWSLTQSYVYRLYPNNLKS